MSCRAKFVGCETGNGITLPSNFIDFYKFLEKQKIKMKASTQKFDRKNMF